MGTPRGSFFSHSLDFLLMSRVRKMPSQAKVNIDSDLIGIGEFCVSGIRA